jgi:serine/threonine protein kinase
MSTQRFVFEPTPHGSGGFGKVIKGYDRFLERQIAVKVLDPLITEFGEEDRERFKREARVLAKLSHPNIPAIYDVSFDEDQFLIIFEYVEGKNLSQFLAEQGACTVTQARRWFTQIASALSHAHDNGVIHRDIKPANIILSQELEAAYLVDFGIALSSQDGQKITKSGYVVGTPGYMSPEQECGQGIDPRSDIYSLGVTLYEALAGQHLGPGPYKPISMANEAVPSEIDALIQDCLLPCDQRIASARDFASRLAGAFRLQKPLSDVLARGKLTDLAVAIEQLTAEALAALPAGQRALILTKVESVISADEENLVFPGAALLDLMVERGLLLPPDDFRPIVRSAIVWAFDKVYPNGQQGRPSLQGKLKDACLNAKGGTHDVLREEIETFLEGVDLGSKPDWYLHNLRQVISCLMANPSFTEAPHSLSAHLNAINTIQRSRPD